MTKDLKMLKQNKVVLDELDNDFFGNYLNYKNTRIVHMVSTIKRTILKNQINSVSFHSLPTESEIKCFRMNFINFDILFKFDKNCLSFNLTEENKEVEKALKNIGFFLCNGVKLEKETLDIFNLTDIEIEQLYILNFMFKFAYTVPNPIEFLNVCNILLDNFHSEVILRNIGLIKMIIYKLGIIGFTIHNIAPEDDVDTLTNLINLKEKVNNKFNDVQDILKDSLIEIAKDKNKEFNEDTFRVLIETTKDIMIANISIDNLDNFYDKFESSLYNTFSKFSDNLTSSFTIAIREALVEIEDINKYNEYKKEQEKFI